MKGKVIESTGVNYKILHENNIYNAIIKGKFKINKILHTNPISVGDNVDFFLERNEIGVITKIYKRKNYIIRKCFKQSKFSHIIASNIDLALLIICISQPKTKLIFIDNFLICAKAYNIPVMIIINKKDLHTYKEKKKSKIIKEIYSPLGYNILEICSNNYKDIEVIKKSINNKTCLISGNSGVGKSTIINKLLPSNIKIKTANISKNFKGKNTTSYSKMFRLNNNTFIIDTPGVKIFENIYINKIELKQYFPEFNNQKCKFDNCLHTSEPDCEVKKKINTIINIKRYMNYLNILNKIKQYEKNSIRRR